MKEVRISRGLQVGWEGMKNNWPVLLGLLALYVVASIVQNALKSLLDGIPLIGLLFWLLSMGVNILLGLILTKFGLQIALGQGAKAASFGDLELDAETVGRYFLTSLLYSGAILLVLAVVFAAVLLFAGVSVGVGALASKEALSSFVESAGGALVLGFLVFFAILVYAALEFSFAHIAVLHEGLGPFEALAESRRLTQGIKGGLLLMFLAYLGVMLLGFCCLIIGIIPAVMVLAVAMPAIYLDVLDQSGPRV